MTWFDSPSIIGIISLSVLAPHRLLRNFYNGQTRFSIPDMATGPVQTRLLSRDFTDRHSSATDHRTDPDRGRLLLLPTLQRDHRRRSTRLHFLTGGGDLRRAAHDSRGVGNPDDRRAQPPEENWLPTAAGRRRSEQQSRVLFHAQQRDGHSSGQRRQDRRRQSLSESPRDLREKQRRRLEDRRFGQPATIGPVADRAGVDLVGGKPGVRKT